MPQKVQLEINSAKKNSKTRKNNFDLIRLLLAVSVAIAHLAILTGNSALGEISEFFSAEIAVDAFFIISGFLIFMSFEASRSLSQYTLKRVRRIFPGYAAVILLCAIFLYFVSDKGLVEYFNLEWIKYIFFNLLTLNFLQPTLPGVFDHNLWTAVNGALWTIKIEVLFYATVPLIVYLLSKTSKIWTLGMIYLLSVLYSLVMIWAAEYYGSENYMMLEKQLPGQLAFFISGAGVYYFQAAFQKNALTFFFISLSLLLIHTQMMDLALLYPAALGVVVIYMATALRYLGDFGKFGDLSFGIYIWHFPIIQIFVTYDLFDRPAIAIPALILSILSVSYLSWHVVEKRFLYASSHYRTAEK